MKGKRAFNWKKKEKKISKKNGKKRKEKKRQRGREGRREGGKEGRRENTDGNQGRRGWPSVALFCEDFLGSKRQKTRFQNRMAAWTARPNIGDSRNHLCGNLGTLLRH